MAKRSAPKSSSKPRTASKATGKAPSKAPKLKRKPRRPAAQGVAPDVTPEMVPSGRRLLYLMRHGIAQDRDDPAAPADPDRQLTRKGVARTRQAARGLRLLKVQPGAILTSPYLRAVATAHIAARALHCDEQAIVQTEALLPDCDPAQLFRELERVPAGEVLCVGHAPSIDEICAYALGGGRGPLTELKKAAVACIQLDPLPEPHGRLLWLMEPGALRLLGEARPKRRA